MTPEPTEGPGGDRRISRKTLLKAALVAGTGPEALSARPLPRPGSCRGPGAGHRSSLDAYGSR
ncbi:hypothetical protein OG978_18630 [Streptomyces sp. NBC_01591]|uniref:hypothetical protein n=1 Tax=Streptomyces sp. NBC_01591 TaxID=2975888 RepID=UPI002DDBC922|nr:hypothetical protein [Streptomyces sp. NBC_01591]WSD69239.1 hypothetical protein OG978_18630 [Streptomyces sp. NBC_01591]